MRTTIFVFIGLIFFSAAQAQYINQKSAALLEQHVNYLADDKLEGRLTGTKGEQLAMEYISGQFKDAGLKPAGTEGYFQGFGFTESIKPGPGTKLSINGKELTKDEFYPLAVSGNGSVAGDMYYAGFGIHAPALDYDDYKGNGERKGKIFIIEISSPDGLHPHSKYVDYTSIAKKVETAKEYGAAGIIFINSDPDAEAPSPKLSSKVQPYDIPVVFCSKKINYLTIDEIKMGVELQKNTATGHNVIGFIDNKAANTVVIGAHYDHLGYGDEDHSLYRGEPAIHNGADDNASGTSALIEMARILKKSKWKNNNYLFIAFSGEELGLLGSNQFAKSELFSQYTINYMLNMDMVGRLDTDKTLIVNGVGTSPAWSEALNGIDVGGMKIKTTESGIGPSDHTSFYLKDVPVLHFFSGTHNDYHKPSDDADKINYKGMQDICDYMLTLIGKLDAKGKLEFSKTKETEQGKVSAFKVTLGIVPDYAYEGEGLRIDGVTDGKPASAAGLKAGDIILQLGSEKIKDIYAYMAALGKFKKGDEVEVIFKRGSEEMKGKVKF
jgi:hypothetical protein